MQDPNKEVTVEEGVKSLHNHIVEKALGIRAKYGKVIDFHVLQNILTDGEFVKYPTTIEFDTSQVDQGLFAVAKKVSNDPSDGYIICIHDHFLRKLDDVPALVLYHLVTINYGDFVTLNEAELFGSTVLGMDQEEYYKLLCRLADEIPQ